MKKSFKNAIITAVVILSIFSLTACGNTQTNDKEVTTTTSAPVTTAPNVENETVVTTTVEQPTDVETTTTSSDDVATTTTTVTTAPEETVTTTSKNPSTEKNTTTSKNTTTTTKKTETKNDTSTYSAITEATYYATSSVNVRAKADASSTKLGTLAKSDSITVIGENGNWFAVKYSGKTAFVSKNYLSKTKPTTNSGSNNNSSGNSSSNSGSSNASTSKGTTMWVNETSFIYSLKNNSWEVEENTVGRGEKVTAYENKTLTEENTSYTKIKKSDGTTGYVQTYKLSKSESDIVDLTQVDIEKICEELQEYATEKHFKTIKSIIESEIEQYKEKLPDGYCWETYQKEIIDRMDGLTPENDRNWTCPVRIYPSETYEKAYQRIKASIDGDYKNFPDSHLTLYIRWCPNGKGCTNTYETKDCWDVYTLR